MRDPRRSRTAFLVASATLALIITSSCGGGGTTAPRDHRGPFVWFETCGDPVCRGHSDHGVSPCTNERVGDTCSPEGSRCDPMSFCNSDLLCTDHDPKQNPGGCPISRRSAKTNIHYLTDADRQRLHEELLRFRLATYQYVAPEAKGRTGLGFIIDDVAPSPSVDPERDLVDLYGYTSMAVATIQQQDARIRTLEAEVEELKRRLDHETPR
jgi:hypothetical protein